MSLVSEFFFGSAELLLWAVDANSFQGVMPSTTEPSLEGKETKKQSIREGSVEKKRSEKRKRSLVRKSDENGRRYEAAVYSYIAVRQKGWRSIYTNCFSPSWAPRPEVIVGYLPDFTAWLILRKKLTIQ